MSREDEGSDPAAEEETVLQEEGTAGPAQTKVLAEAATVLAEDEDRTQLVTRPPAPPLADSGAATRVEASASQELSGAGPLKPTRILDPAAPPRREAAAPDSADGLEAATHLIDEADKTAPPPVPSAPRAPASIDPERGLTPGTVLFGEYEIVNVLGVGGMGEVYRARHRRLDEHRAIKVMHAELSKKKGASEFFYREAKALLAVRHPAVVHCHDLLSDEEGRVYLIMEMIEGIALSKKMNDGPLSPDDVAILGARVAHGLSAAHRKGVIHRDVSPDNIVLPNGRVQEAKIIDFGIAKILQEGEGTIVDGFKGKLSYASPEQLGFFGGKMDGRSDFYSLGLVLAAAALGRPMGMGTTVMEAVDARRGFNALPDEIPVGLRSAIQPLLALDPKDRPKYVDRLFVVPGGIDAAAEPGGYADAGGSDLRSSSSREQAAGGGRSGLYAGIAASLALAMGGGAYWALGPGATGRDADAPARKGAGAVVVEPPGRAPEVEPRQTAPLVVETPEVVEQAPAAPSPKAEAKAAEPPKPRRLTASDRIQIIGLLSNAKMALAENRLMSPAGDNAYDRYRRILSLDPDNAKAKAGLREVATRYLSLANASAAKGETDQVRTYLDRARQADPNHPGLEGAEDRLRRP